MGKYLKDEGTQSKERRIVFSLWDSIPLWVNNRVTKETRPQLLVDSTQKTSPRVYRRQFHNHSRPQSRLQPKGRFELTNNCHVRERRYPYYWRTTKFWSSSYWLSAQPSPSFLLSGWLRQRRVQTRVSSGLGRKLLQWTNSVRVDPIRGKTTYVSV